MSTDYGTPGMGHFQRIFLMALVLAMLVVALSRQYGFLLAIAMASAIWLVVTFVEAFWNV